MDVALVNGARSEDVASSEGEDFLSSFCDGGDDCRDVRGDDDRGDDCPDLGLMPRRALPPLPP